MSQVKADKLREVKNGHDGTWVAHPALVTLALEIFNEHMPQPNQIDTMREDVHITRDKLLEVLTDYPQTVQDWLHWTHPAADHTLALCYSAQPSAGVSQGPTCVNICRAWCYANHSKLHTVRTSPFAHVHT